MARRNCLECGGTGGDKDDFVFCADCNKFALHRYCFEDWPKTKLGEVHWICGCRDEIEESNSDSEIEEIDAGDEEEDDNFFKQPENGVSEPNDDKPMKNSGSEMNQNQDQDLVRRRIPNMVSFTFYGKMHRPAKPVEPLIRSVWSGDLLVKFMYGEPGYRSIDGFSAFLSNKASKMAQEEGVRFDPVMRLEMVAKDLVWPKRFGEDGPSGEDIDLYFFPCLRNHGNQVYDYFVYEMGRDDVALRMRLENGELLIFTSMELPSKLRRFQGTLYLWGFVKEKDVENDCLCGLAH